MLIAPTFAIGSEGPSNYSIDPHEACTGSLDSPVPIGTCSTEAIVDEDASVFSLEALAASASDAPGSAHAIASAYGTYSFNLPAARRVLIRATIAIGSASVAVSSEMNPVITSIPAYDWFIAGGPTSASITFDLQATTPDCFCERAITRSSPYGHYIEDSNYPGAIQPEYTHTIVISDPLGRDMPAGTYIVRPIVTVNAWLGEQVPDTGWSSGSVEGRIIEISVTTER